MGKARISSQEISDYTNINATQIRRDLSAFGKFGKRGVGYNIDSLLGEIRKILRTQGQHNILLVGAGRLGEAIVSSPIFAEHGIHIAAIVDTDPEKVGRQVGDIGVGRHHVYLPDGRYPLRGSAWRVSDQLHEVTQIPSYAIVLAVIFAVVFLLGLLFLLIKERTVQGVVQVTVQGAGFAHATQVPVSSYSAARTVRHQVNHIRHLAAAA